MSKNSKYEVVCKEDGKLMAMLKVGLQDENAGKDIHDLRTLIDGYRTAKRTATKTIVQAFVVFILGLLSMSAFVKFWR